MAKRDPSPSETIPAKRRRGRPPNPNPQTGGLNKQPRSLARVFRAVRGAKKRTQGQMLELLASQPSNYTMTNGNGDRNDRVRTWESGKGQPTFAVLHRYGLAADVPSGVLHLTSLIYAHLREAGVVAGVNRRKHLDIVVAIADALASLAAEAKGLARRYDKGVCDKYRFHEDEQSRQTDTLEVCRDACINEILDSFRKSPAWRRRDRSVDRGRKS